MLHLNFDQEQNPLDNAALEAIIQGQPEVQVDPITGKRSCYFDGDSFLQFPPEGISSNDFSIQLLFRPQTIGLEQGIFGTRGYRLALRTDPRESSLSFWATFPSSNNPQRVQMQFDLNTWTTQEHYFGVRRSGSTFTVQLDNEFTTFDYPCDYIGYVPLIGTYYDRIYAFNGFIRQYRLDFEALNLQPPVTGSLF